MSGRYRKLTLTALFAVIIAFFSWISVPTPLTVPVTLQVFGVSLCGFALGAKWGGACIAVYITMGAVGLPVFSFFQGGISVLTSQSGGFVFGFLLLGIFCGLSRLCKPKFLMPILGLLLCHTVGVLQFCLVTGSGVLGGIITASLPFILKDGVLIFLAHQTSKRIKLGEIYD
ncbi:MAG: biotin transporter BioY [Clostridia bacterium]|nr:biotin transporter BioY [Clostridia bacterium]